MNRVASDQEVRRRRSVGKNRELLSDLVWIPNFLTLDYWDRTQTVLGSLVDSA